MDDLNMRKEIMVFTDGMGNCGIQRVLSELTDAWVRMGHRVSIIYIQKDARKTDDFTWSNEIDMIGVQAKGNAVAIYAKLLVSYIKLLRARPDAIAVSLSVMTNFVMGACAPFVLNKIIISDRNDPTRRPGGTIKQFFRDIAFKLADNLIFQTEAVKEYYMKRIHKDGVVIPNPINANLPIKSGGIR